MIIRTITRILLFSMLLAGGAHAAEYEANSLGTLFTDTGQRAQIDAARAGSRTSATKKKTSKITVNGYMTRSDGKSVVWVNDKNTLDSSQVGDVRVHGSTIGNDKKVTISTDGQHKRLRPGETWHKQTGKVGEDY